jgi:hypothetical protein
MYGLDLPHLTIGNHTPTSPQDRKYNCVSHSIFENLISYWPDQENHWPKSVTYAETVEAFVEFFQKAGFFEIPVFQVIFEPGFEKIAIYADSGFPLHVARQLNSGRWTSKFGVLVDIEHEDLNCLEHGTFGHVVKVMKRIQTNRPPVIADVHPPRPLIIRP